MHPVRNLMFVGLALIVSATQAAPPKLEDQYDTLRGLIKPGKEEEPWATIPWRTDLWQARQVAAKEGKPLLLWEMDGHPLGCV